MSNEITPIIKNETIPVSLEELVNKAKDYARMSKAKNTLRAYKAAWKDFENWCAEKEIISLPSTSEVLALFLTNRADDGLKLATLRIRYAAIRQYHLIRGYKIDRENPILMTVWEGIIRAKGIQQKGKEALLTHDIRGMIFKQDSTIKGIRNKAIILLGFSGASRRTEISSLNIEDLEFKEMGMTFMLNRSKTDQKGAGRLVAIPFSGNTATCTVTAVKTWIAAARITEGPLFRMLNKGQNVTTHRLSDRSIAKIVKAAASEIGLDPKKYSGHSLRSGHVTTALAAGAKPNVIMNQTGQKSLETLFRYDKNNNIFINNSCQDLGL